MSITTEGLLTSPMGFGLTTTTPVQRASCRVGDGLPLGDLKDDPDVIGAFGGHEAIAALPSERGIKPVEFYDISSPRTAKTMRAICRAIVASQTVDLSSLKVGEVPRVSIMSLKLDVADVPYRLLTGCLQSSPVLRNLIVRIDGDSVEVKHPSGRTVEIAVVAGGRAAGGLVARWSAGLIADEGTRMLGADEGVANLTDALSAIRERLLPGAQIQVVGQPHAPFGPAHDAFEQYFGKPTDEIVAMKTTGPAGNPYYWTRDRLAKLRRRDPSAADVAEFARFLSPESNLFASTALEVATRKEPLELPCSEGMHYAAAMDPGTRSNSWTLVIVEADLQNPKRPRFRVALAREWTGSKLQPLRTDIVLAEIAKCCRRYAVRDVITDQWSIDALKPQALDVGLRLLERNMGTAERVDAYDTAKELVNTGALELAPVQQLREDLLRVKKRVTQSGITIDLPVVGGRHCDFAPSLVLAVSCVGITARKASRGEGGGTFGSCQGERYGSPLHHAARHDKPARPHGEILDSYSKSVQARRQRLMSDE